MTVTRRMWGWAAAAVLCGTPVAAQELAIKGAVTISQFSVSGTGTAGDITKFDDPLTATGFGGLVRFRFGRLVLQPEVQVVTRGARVSQSDNEDEQLRLEYLELPLLLVLPVRLGKLEPYALGGGMVAVETRCRYVVKNEGLRSNLGCDSPGATAFDRNKADYGLVAGGGVTYPIGGGRLLLDVRHTWGMRNIVDEDDVSIELRNRTFMAAIGYTMTVPRDER